MKKVLIWDTVELKNIGGPSGYLYNLHSFLMQEPSDQIVFLSDLLKKASNNLQERDYTQNKRKSIFLKVCDLYPSSFKNLFFSRCIKKMLDSWLYVYNFFWRQFRQPFIIPSTINLNDYDFIHFHLMPDLLRFKNNKTKFNGKIIFTSHCPCTWTDEVIFFENRKWLAFFRRVILWQELKCYKSADYIMFPCKEAREPYEKEPTIKKILTSKENNIFYIPTGILKDISTTNIDLSIYGIPSQSFVIGFFGRHSKIKGYDLLKDVAERLLKKYDNLYFLCAGKGEVPPLNHPRWIELGFINNIQDFLPKCDLYILPNQDTYFDLIVLEIFRAGTIALLSNNGGNRYFKNLPQKETIGIDFFNIQSKTEIFNLVEKNIKLNKENTSLYQTRKKMNQVMFYHYFTVDKYVKKYLSTIELL